MVSIRAWRAVFLCCNHGGGQQYVCLDVTSAQASGERYFHWKSVALPFLENCFDCRITSKVEEKPFFFSCSFFCIPVRYINWIKASLAKEHKHKRNTCTSFRIQLNRWLFDSHQLDLVAEINSQFRWYTFLHNCDCDDCVFPSYKFPISGLLPYW